MSNNEEIEVLNTEQRSGERNLEYVQAKDWPLNVV